MKCGTNPEIILGKNKPRRSLRCFLNVLKTEHSVFSSWGGNKCEYEKETRTSYQRPGRRSSALPKLAHVLPGRHQQAKIAAHYV